MYMCVYIKYGYVWSYIRVYRKSVPAMAEPTAVCARQTQTIWQKERKKKLKPPHDIRSATIFFVSGVQGVWPSGGRFQQHRQFSIVGGRIGSCLISWATGIHAHCCFRVLKKFERGSIYICVMLILNTHTTYNTEIRFPGAVSWAIGD